MQRAKNKRNVILLFPNRKSASVGKFFYTTFVVLSGKIQLANFVLTQYSKNENNQNITNRATALFYDICSFIA